MFHPFHNIFFWWGVLLIPWNFWGFFFPSSLNFLGGIFSSFHRNFWVFPPFHGISMGFFFPYPIKFWGFSPPFHGIFMGFFSPYLIKFWGFFPPIPRNFYGFFFPTSHYILGIFSPHSMEFSGTPLPQHRLNTEWGWARYFSWKFLRMGMRLGKVGRNEASASQQFFINL